MYDKSCFLALDLPPRRRDAQTIFHRTTRENLFVTTETRIGLGLSRDIVKRTLIILHAR